MVVALKKTLIYILIIVIVAGLTIYLLNKTSNAGTALESETYTVTEGTVSRISNVSGTTEANEIANLRFPVTGVVKEVFKDEGTYVTKGEILASLVLDSRVATYNAAMSTLAYQEGVRNEILRGPRAEMRTVTETSVDIARENLTRTQTEYEARIDQARQTLLSTDLQVEPVNKNSDDTWPTVSGTYTCDKEGTYTLSVFESNAQSGHSYRLSGLESGTYTAFSNAPSPMGTCGLSIKFNPNELYQKGTWVINIPNTRGASYLANKTAYDLLLTQADNAIESAEQSLELSEYTQKNLNAAPSTETLTQINAQIEAARASLALTEAQIADYVIKAPYDGIITNSTIKVGEVASEDSRITIIREGGYELTARIPEADVRRITEGNTATAIFDAAPNEPIPARIEFISPTAIQIDGVAYYEAHIRLSFEPAWLKEGMNADIDIMVEKKEGVLVVPKRFIIEENDTYFTHILHNNKPVKIEIEVGLIGNDGFIEVMNVPKGTTIIIP